MLSAYLFPKLQQDVVKLLHHLWVDSFSRPDVSKVKQHVKSSLRGAQCLERIIDEVFSFVFDRVDLTMEPFHNITPIRGMAKAEWIKGDLENLLNNSENKYWGK